MKWLKRIGAVVTVLGLIHQVYDWYTNKRKS